MTAVCSDLPMPAAIRWLILFSLLLLDPAVAEPTADKQGLLSFISQVPHESRVNWNASTSACTWVGVACDSTNSSVIYLRLPGVGLIGEIPPDTLGRLTQLRVLSLHSNRLSGEIPADFSRLTFLRNVYLQNNLFSGGFPASFTELDRITRLDLSSNNFTGPIPFSLNNLSHLTGVFLQNNGFSGAIPSIALPGLVGFNVSSNRLNGSIPTTLARFPESSFANNLALCGSPLPPCNPFFPSPAPSPTIPAPSPRSNRRISTGAIIGICVAGGILILLLLLAILFLLIRRRKREIAKEKKAPATATASALGEAGTSSSKDEVAGGSADAAEKNKLIFLGNSGLNFDLEDLLRASAEVLGKGSMGTSYKAVLEEGTTVVVKRLKDVGVGRKEFEQQMELLGRIQHQNLLPLRAYYYSKDEKLLVSDYMPSGSLSSLLHGSRGSGRSPLEWESRLRIAQSAARGLAHLHVVAKLVHGNIKASNILLKLDHVDACVSDVGLNPLFLQSTPLNHRVMGYRAPEVIETRKVTFKSDVYSFGVLILELLTGKPPNQASLGEEGIDLPRWVQSVVREEWTAEVFDVELMRHHNVEEEMVQLLQIGMVCVATVPDQRPDMPQVSRMVDEVNRGETDDGVRQSSNDVTKGGSGSQTPARASPPDITP